MPAAAVVGFGADPTRGRELRFDDKKHSIRERNSIRDIRGKEFLSILSFDISCKARSKMLCSLFLLDGFDSDLFGPNKNPLHGNGTK